MDHEVDNYLVGAPIDQRETLVALRSSIRQAMPEADEVIESGFPVYKINDQWTAGFATRKKGPMLYIMVHEVLDRYADQLGPLRSGKSCIAFRSSKSITLDELWKLVPKMLNEARKARSPC